jgi:hypothetical protein
VLSDGRAVFELTAAGDLFHFDEPDGPTSPVVGFCLVDYAGRGSIHCLSVTASRLACECRAFAASGRCRHVAGLRLALRTLDKR